MSYYALTGIDCGDIAVTAAEGGIGYWSQIESYKPSRWSDIATGDPVNVPHDFVFYTIRDDPSGKSEGTTEYDITPTLIRRGWAKLPVDRRTDDMGDVDSALADWIIQLGCFGRLVYS